MDTAAIVIVVVAAFVILLLLMGIRVVPEYRRLVVLRLGRLVATRGPGLVLVIPFIDRPIGVDLREQFIEIPRQTTITKDNATITIDFLIYYRVVDPDASVLKVGSFQGASIGVATTTLRAVVGDISLDEALSNRERINTQLREKLDEVTARWGVKVTAVEIREIEPPRAIQEAMDKQMSAERERRAIVLSAQGQREATINIAEGDKQAAILRAEGERAAQMTRAEGFAQALRTIYGAAMGVDNKTMTLQYFEALKVVGASPSTKFVFPMEFASFMRPVLESAANVGQRGGDGSPPAAP
ncbi:MAG: SPFH/Band 7/PHB domain protein [Actinobacteria bacterium]|nr:SPFH/Band 7/PHB domain protein [Actinomycetota bacterium]